MLRDTSLRSQRSPLLSGVRRVLLGWTNIMRWGRCNVLWTNIPSGVGWPVVIQATLRNESKTGVMLHQGNPVGSIKDFIYYSWPSLSSSCLDIWSDSSSPEGNTGYCVHTEEPFLQTLLRNSFNSDNLTSPLLELTDRLWKTRYPSIRLKGDKPFIHLYHRSISFLPLI